MNETIKTAKIRQAAPDTAPGAGCHTQAFGMANLGALAGIPSFTASEDIRAAIPHVAAAGGDRRNP